MVSLVNNKRRRRAFWEGFGSAFQLFPSRSSVHERYRRELDELTKNRGSDYEMFLRDLGVAMDKFMSTLSPDEQRRVREHIAAAQRERGDAGQLPLPFRE